MIKEIDDTMGNDLSTLSGPGPGVSVSVTVNEAGKRVLQFRGIERSHQEADGYLPLDQIITSLDWTAASTSELDDGLHCAGLCGGSPL